MKHIVIPPAEKVKRADQSDIRPLHQTYPDIVDEIHALSRPGTLVLVGAGIIGKFLIDEARQSGAVAIDVGSMLDYFAGRKTRSLADMI